jgi:hypothetical protein
MAQVTDLIDYYVNLLIIQYNQKPKARATIRALVSELLASGVFFDVRDGYSVDTAVGVQLDIIGKYVGVDRFFSVTDPIDYFAFTDYIEVDPDDEDKFGLTDYASFDDFQHNGTLNYNSVITVENRLNDDDFRIIIKLKIVQNNSNHSHESIDDSMWEFFADQVRPDSEGGMQMTYFLSENLTPVIQAALIKNILPRPMGVGINLINNVSGVFLGYASYGNIQNNYQNPNITGFADYDDYDTKEGEFLSYGQITVA